MIFTLGLHLILSCFAAAMLCVKRYETSIQFTSSSTRQRFGQFYDGARILIIFVADMTLREHFVS